MHPTTARSFVFISCVAAVLMFAGCASNRGAQSGRGMDRTATPPAPIPEMEAHGTFLDGDLRADVVLNSAGFGPRGSSAVAGGPPGGGRGGFGGGRGGRRGGGGEGGRGPGREASDDQPAPHIVASNEPPVRLHLMFTNRSFLPIELEVPDFNSELGNFVVQPPKITVPPKGSIEVEPMTSRLGVNSDQIPLTVTIRSNGRTEKQVLMLRVKAPASAPPSAPPPPATPPST